MTRPLTRAQRRENAAFLAELRRTGNAREAARRLGAHRARFTRRRAKHPEFAAQWDAALALADAALAERRSKHEPTTLSLSKPVLSGCCKQPAEGGRTSSPHIVRTKAGLQLRRALPGRIDAPARQRFLAALSATANVRLSARAAGFTHAAFYTHKRADPGFAREWRLALELGYQRLQTELIAGWEEDAVGPDDWSRNDPPPIPPMTAGEALQLLYLHQKEARLLCEPDWLKRRRGESWEARGVRLSAMAQAQLEREREKFRLAQAVRREAAERGPEDTPEPPVLPDLAQVTGWSKASGKPPHEAGRALFGGWRLENWEERDG